LFLEWVGGKSEKLPKNEIIKYKWEARLEDGQGLDGGRSENVLATETFEISLTSLLKDMKI
jgi:hypothetical protein